MLGKYAVNEGLFNQIGAGTWTFFLETNREPRYLWISHGEGSVLRKEIGVGTIARMGIEKMSPELFSREYVD